MVSATAISASVAWEDDVYASTSVASGLRQPESVAQSPPPPRHVVTGIRQPEHRATEPPTDAQPPLEFGDHVPDYWDDSDDDYTDSDYSDYFDYGDREYNSWEFGGWIQQGVTFNRFTPNDRFNGVVVTNDRANEYQMNQLWLYLHREADTGGYGWDYGGYAGVVYGTDAEFFQKEDGLEARWGQNARFYQLAIPFFYLDIAYNDWTLTTGRFSAPVGFEPIAAVENFFYSRSYNWWAQPNTLWGMMLTRQMTDSLSLSAGIHRGSDQFDDTDGKNALNFVGGGSWVSWDERSWLDVYVIAEERGPRDNTLYYSVVGGTDLGRGWNYAIEWYYGETDTPRRGEWYGINQHFIKAVNDCWSYGMRFEWFRDDNGLAVFGFRDGNTADGPFIGNFYELTFALNYTPRENFALRPEIRWDWYSADRPGGPLPFNDGTRSRQFLFSLDMIYTF